MFFFFFENLLSYLAYSQIWLNMRSKLPEISCAAVMSVRALARRCCCVVRSFVSVPCCIDKDSPRPPAIVVVYWSPCGAPVCLGITLAALSFTLMGLGFFCFCFCTLIFPWLAT